MFKVLIEEIKGSSPGKVYIVPRGTTRVGRKNADIEIANERISSSHAEVHFSGTRVTLIDTNSTNGTYVNNRKIKRVALKDGDIVSFGGMGEKAISVYKIKFEGDLKKVVYVINRGIDSPNRYLYLFLTALVFAVFIWLIIPSGDHLALKGGAKPWEKPEDLLPPYAQGVQRTLALGDTVVLPDSDWKSEVRSEIAKDTGSYETKIYSVDIMNPAEASQGSNSYVQANITVQRFKKDFTGSTEVERIKNFVWHEDNFLKENNIKEKFSYSKSKTGLWQWVIWNDGEKFVLYASTVTGRGRTLIQASSFDIYVLKRFFQYIADSYQEGKPEEIY